jgi:hypothetical protein
MAHCFAGQAMLGNKKIQNQVIVKATNKCLIAARDNSKPVKTLIDFSRPISHNMFHVVKPGRDPAELKPELKPLAMQYDVGQGTASIDHCMMSFYVSYEGSERQNLDAKVEQRKEMIGRKLHKVKDRVYGNYDEVNELTDRLNKITLEKEAYERLLQEQAKVSTS